MRVRVTEVPKGMADEVRIARLSTAEWYVLAGWTLFCELTMSVPMMVLSVLLGLAVLVGLTYVEPNLADSLFRRLRDGGSIRS